MSDTRNALPAVHKLLAEAERNGLTDIAPREMVVNAIRETLDTARDRNGTPPDGGWIAEVERRLDEKQKPSLTSVVNATGVILHTNLGRAPLAESARQAIVRTAGYTNLEYDFESGERGSRHVHVRDLLREMTGAEDAIVVTNAAAALVLALNTLANNGETIVSRGELIEIGGAFRIPSILEKSGTILVEVGSTNRTRLRDYVGALSARTKCCLKVHRSNFRLSGFVTDVETADLVREMTPRGVPVMHDVGSGLIVDLTEYGLSGEPLVQDSIKEGATVVFSGDKLLGGPQAGILAGSAEMVGQASVNPLMRALRPGKTVLAALEATLALYRDRATALSEIPTLAMLTARPDTLSTRAETLASLMKDATTEPGTSSVGGGSFPDADLPTTLVAVATDHPDAFLTALRHHAKPVVARADAGRVLFDPRTIDDNDFEAIVAAVATAQRG